MSDPETTALCVAKGQGKECKERETHRGMEGRGMIRQREGEGGGEREGGEVGNKEGGEVLKNRIEEGLAP